MGASKGSIGGSWTAPYQHACTPGCALGVETHCFGPWGHVPPVDHHEPPILAARHESATGMVTGDVQGAQKPTTMAFPGLLEGPWNKPKPHAGF